MNLLFRFLWYTVRSLFRSRIGLLEVSRIPLRILPNDLDLNFHMNNGRYLSIMDLGRMDWLGRCGLMKPAWGRRWFPVVGSVTIRFSRPLNSFQSYVLTTRVLCWDEKWFYMEQRFELPGKTAAVAVIKGLFRGPGGNVTPAEVLRAMGSDLVSPPIPESVVRLNAADAT